MRTSTTIKLTMFLGSVCLTAWQLPGILDRVEKLKEGGVLPGVGGMDIRSAAALAALGAEGGSMFGPAEAKADVPRSRPNAEELVVYGVASTLSAEQRDRMLKHAATQAPLKPGVVVRRGTPPGQAGKPAGQQPANPLDKPLSVDDATQAVEQLQQQVRSALGAAAAGALKQ